MPDENGNYVNPEDKVDTSDLSKLSKHELRWAADRGILTADQIKEFGLDRPHDPGSPALPEEYVGDVDTAAYHGVEQPSGPTINHVGPDSEAKTDEDGGDGSDEDKSLDEMTADELKAQIDLRNEEDPEAHLSKSGTKQELLDRIEEYDRQHEG